MLCRIAVKLHILVVQALVVVVAFGGGNIGSHGALYKVDVLLFLTIVVGAVCHDGVKPLEVGFDIKLYILRHCTDRCEQ